MADAPSQSTTRPDMDIEVDIQDLIAHYPPLAHDQHHFEYDVDQGVVKVWGNVKSHVTQQYLLSQLPKVDGVREVQGQNLINDDDIRLDAAQLVPAGVFVNVEYGIVKLTGRLDDGTNVDGLVENISQRVNGIRRIYTSFI
jgi:osmotically-inducible protein OsmY